MTLRRQPGRTLVLTLAIALGGLTPAVGRAADAGDPLVEEARTKMRKKDVRGAISALEKALAADPTDADAHILYQDVGRDVLGAEALITSYRQKAGENPNDPMYAFLYARLLRPDDALSEFGRQILKFPASAWPHAGKARVLEALGRGAEAAPEYDAAVMAAPTEVRFKAYQAYGLERTGSWPSVVEAWKSVLAARPTDRAARLGLAEGLRKTAAYDDAVAVLNDVLKADPKDAEALYRLGITNMDAGRLDDAIKALDFALSIDRTFVEAYCAASEASLKQVFAAAAKEKRDPTEKEFEKALGYGGKAAAVGSDRADAHFAFAAAHEAAAGANSTHYDPASVEYDAALNLLPLPSPEKVRALCAKAFVLLFLQKWDQSVAAADKAIGIDEKCVAAYAHAGFALCAQGKHDEAIRKYYRPGLKIAPDDARLHHALGVALWETTHEADAKKELEAAVKVEPENYRYRMTLGQLYYDLKMYKPAGEQLFKIVDVRPNDPEVWRVYGRICCALKNWDQGIESYEKIIELLKAPKADAAAPPAGNPPAGGAAPPAPAGTSPNDDLLKKAHLYLAIIYGDHQKKRDKAKEHVKAFLALGGQEPNLQSWMDDLLADK